MTSSWDDPSIAVRRFPGPRHRISSVVGAETCKVDPDSPQWPVRQRALEDGKTVYMTVPKLAQPGPFFLLDPEELADSPRRASSIKGAQASARPVGIADRTPLSEARDPEAWKAALGRVDAPA